MDDLLEKPEVISFERLYKLWEKANWSATELDFSVDAEHWRNELDDLQRDAALWNYSLFLVGEEAVARTLTPVLDAAPGFAASIFLTTQIVDEARHHVFFDRFIREVAGLGTDTASTLGESDRYLTWGFRQVFAELDRVTTELRRKPKELPLLAQSVALYHVVIEGLLAIPGQHFIQRYLKERDILPAFRAGIDNVSRDEARHVAFGIKLLGDLIRGSKECRAAAIEMWDKVLPWSAGVFIPPNFDRRYTESFGFTLEEIYAFGMRSLETKLTRLGVDPGEVGILAHEDRSLTYLERADRVDADPCGSHRGRRTTRAGARRGSHDDPHGGSGEIPRRTSGALDRGDRVELHGCIAVAPRSGERSNPRSSAARVRRRPYGSRPRRRSGPRSPWVGWIRAARCWPGA